MRITDMLQTETPRPCLDDDVFPAFTTMVPNPVVIDGTDVAALFMEMTLFGDFKKTPEQQREIEQFEEVLGESVGWQVASFLQFDFSTLGCCAPPFPEFVIEFDTREAMHRASRAIGHELRPRDIVHVGQQAAAFATFTNEEWVNRISTNTDYNRPGAQLPQALPTGATMREIEALPFRWMMVITTFRTEPGEGLIGPVSTWIIPLDQDGKVFIDTSPATLPGQPQDFEVMHAFGLGPRCKGDQSLSNEYALSQGWAVILPALLALNFMHTPRSTKQREGYHDLIEQEVTGRLARKFLERNFRPMVKWHVLDISPLREAVKKANGGKMPTDFRGLKKALHVVRGHSATYMPNTYFGRKHERPITVFKPSFRRGDVRAGVVSKDYRVNTGEAS